MSKQRHRDEFIGIMAEEGMPVSTARLLIRHAATLHRLAELECSSEAANRDRVPCPRKFWRWEEGKRAGCLCSDQGNFDYTNTGNLWSADPKHHGNIPRITLQGARCEARVRMLLANLNAAKSPAKPFEAIFQGDPRGAVLKVKVPSGRTTDWGREGVCVP